MSLFPPLLQLPPPLDRAALCMLVFLVVALLWERARARRASARRQALEDRLKLAMEAADLGAWEWDARKRSLWMDGRARVLHGGEAGRPSADHAALLDLAPEEDRAALRRTYETLSPSAPGFIAEYRMPAPDGSVRHLVTRGRARFDSGGRMTTLSGVTTDITSRRAASLELQQRRAELAHATRALTASQLTGSLGHELNQPLAAIAANAHAGAKSLELRPPDPAELRELLADISADASRAGRIIQHLRAMLRKKAPEAETLELAPLVEETVRLLHTELALKRVLLRHRDVGPGLRVRGDRVQLQQVLVNLLLNAADAMSAQPAATRHLLLAADADADGVRLRIEDRGPGMPPERLAVAFEPFRSGKPQGLGLGLSICHAIMTLHHGSIRLAANSPAPGLTATLRSPPVPAA